MPENVAFFVLLCCGCVTTLGIIDVMSNSISPLADTDNTIHATQQEEDGVFGYGGPPDQFARTFGYPAETHEVTTDDGYILKLFRIPRGKGEDEDAVSGSEGIEDIEGSSRPAVLLMHGIATNALSWFGRDAESLPFLLADAGFDVWLGCSRGSIYGRQHQNVSVNSLEFWDFSWHENGIYDVPATVSYIVGVTGQEKIHYVGHSMGTTMFLVSSSLVPSLREQILGAYLLAPVAYLTNVGGISGPAGALSQSPFKIIIQLASKYLLHEEFQLSSPAVRALLKPLCSSPLTYRICLDTVQAVAGEEADPEEVGLDGIIKYIRSSPDSCSYKQLNNFAQEIGKSVFQRYDYGDPQTNLEKYGSEEPLQYPLQDATTTLSLYYGAGDFLATPENVKTLAQDLPNVRRLVELPNVTHADFLVGKSIRSQLYDSLVKDLLEDAADHK